MPLERIVIICDDLDTQLGTVRLRAKGGHGGQNGMRSIISFMGSNAFPRVKIGIGRPPEGMSVVSHVLGDFRHGAEK